MKAEVQVALDAFREAERAQFLADRKQKASSNALFKMANVCGPEDRKEYYTISSKIVAEYEAKREKAGL